ncbi:MAG: hypothetical protein ACTHZ5_11490 [Micrococcaceae bacterium]
MRTALKRIAATAVVSVGLIVPLSAAGANADNSITQTYSRDQVQGWNNVFTATSACSFFPHPYVAAACALSGSANFKSAIGYAAQNDCQLQIITTPNPNSIGSWDRATYDYKAVNCLS